jgi:hypothetical protein
MWLAFVAAMLIDLSIPRYGHGEISEVIGGRATGWTLDHRGHRLRHWDWRDFPNAGAIGQGFEFRIVPRRNLLIRSIDKRWHGLLDWLEK